VKLLIVVLALTLAGAWIGVRLSQIVSESRAIASGGAATDHAAVSNDDGACCGDGEPANPFGGIFDGSGDVTAVTMPTGGKPLDGVPAGLPLYAGATPMLGYEQATKGSARQMGVWTIAGADTDAVLRFYAEAAESAGFRPAQTSSTSEHSRVFLREGETLLVRARPSGDKVRLSLIFRYTM